MPNKPAAIKALRQTKKHAVHNKKIMSDVAMAIRVARKVVTAQSKDAKDKVKLAIKTLDKAAQKGNIKANTAARKKSRLMKLLNRSVKK